MVAQGHPHGLDVTFVTVIGYPDPIAYVSRSASAESAYTRQTVLATRINLFLGPGLESSPHFLDEGWRGETDILIGCVDSRKARNTIMKSQAYWNSQYCSTIGNNADSANWFWPAG